MPLCFYINPFEWQTIGKMLLLQAMAKQRRSWQQTTWHQLKENRVNVKINARDLRLCKQATAFFQLGNFFLLFKR